MVEEHLVRLSWVNVPPYPQVTLDNFGFPVGGRLAVRRAVFWHRLPKVALFGPKNAVFLPEIIFLWTASKKIVTIMTGHLKEDLFVFTALQGGIFWAKKWSKNQIFLCYTHITHLFWLTIADRRGERGL